MSTPFFGRLAPGEWSVSDDDPEVSAEWCADPERLGWWSLERGLECRRRLRDLGRRDVRLLRGDSLPRAFAVLSTSLTGDSCISVSLACLFVSSPVMLITGVSAFPAFFLPFSPSSAGLSHSTIMLSWVDMLTMVVLAVWTSLSSVATLSA